MYLLYRKSIMKKKISVYIKLNNAIGNKIPSENIMFSSNVSLLLFEVYSIRPDHRIFMLLYRYDILF